MKKQDWKLIGRFIATMVQLFSTITPVFKKAGVGLEALEWAVGTGKGFITLKIKEIVTEYKRLNPVPLVMIDCDRLPEIPDWADSEKPIKRHTPCGLVNPATLKAVNVFRSGEDVLNGAEFIRRAKALHGAMNTCAFDFYVKPENWKYLPKDCDVIVFPNTEFRHSEGYCYVRYLYRRGAGWDRDCNWVGSRFNSGCRVACSQV